eukprot:TRINITY_DN5093_c0_g1_i1.p1 TRINITY_DN5093_c0_g1~~TRINITY_DN5093_c0_g1_i1.p1  ORF type:complete len:1521 (-),score=239.61 TRINITY_DN5093_c0_g1_i1:127-4689(-)
METDIDESENSEYHLRVKFCKDRVSQMKLERGIEELFQSIIYHLVPEEGIEFIYKKFSAGTEDDLKTVLLECYEYIYSKAYHFVHCPSLIQRMLNRLLWVMGDSEIFPSTLSMDQLRSKAFLEIDRYSVIFDSLYEEWSNSTINFDDIQDHFLHHDFPDIPRSKSKGSDEEINKVSVGVLPTFKEPEGILVYLLMLHYYSGVIMFKLWQFSFIYVLWLYIDNTSSVETIWDSLRFIAFVDFVTSLLFLGLKLVIKIPTHRVVTCHTIGHTIVEIVTILRDVSTIGLYFYLQYEDPFEEYGLNLPLDVYYLIARVALVSSFGMVTFFCRQNKCSCLNWGIGSSACSNEDSCYSRFYLVSRWISFVTIMTLLTSVFEYFLIAPSTQKMIIMSEKLSASFEGILLNINYLSFFMQWILLLVSLLIENSLAFVSTMSIAAWMFGRNEGRTRYDFTLDNGKDSEYRLGKFVKILEYLENFKVHTTENKDETSLLDEDEGNTNDDSNSKRKVLTSKIKEDDEISLWNECVDGWRNYDFISSKEAEYLKMEKHPDGQFKKIQKIVNVSSLKSHQAREHISFWLNSLDNIPKNLDYVDKIPLTSIVIPVYEEELEFVWDDARDRLLEIKFLVNKYEDEWNNFCERQNITPSEMMERIEKYKLEIANKGSSEVRSEQSTSLDPKLKKRITTWLSRRDQYVYKTVEGACGYKKALDVINKYTGCNGSVEVILCLQQYGTKVDNQFRYRQRYQSTIDRWLRKFKNLKIAYSDNKHMCLLSSNDGEIKEIKVPHNGRPLLISKPEGRVQGKAMNQTVGILFAQGSYIQVLDCNQGAHWTEYFKFPALIRSFVLKSNNGYHNFDNIRVPIIGTREYIFTKNLSTVGKIHAYQEWAFGTAIQRVYAALGVRLHYGHPDTFVGTWARYNAGLSKINPNINMSEDVFAGFKALLDDKLCDLVEFIQFEKGRETGIGPMSIFDGKISQGNPSIMRTRDLNRLMSDLPALQSFLFFQGICGHFISNSLVMISVYLYVLTLFFLSFGGRSTYSLGDIALGTEWFIHAGLTTVLPLIVELTIEYGALGLFEGLMFFPLSTIAFLFQIQTKHYYFIESIWSGKSSYMPSMRGLDIYRRPLVEIFVSYCNSHFYPALDLMMWVAAYQFISVELQGGTLPLIMVYFFAFSIFFSPQIYNPTLRGASINDIFDEFKTLLMWLTNTSENLSLLASADDRTGHELKKFSFQSNSHLNQLQLYERYALNPSPFIRITTIMASFSVVVFWLVFVYFFVYPDIQVIILFLLVCWLFQGCVYLLVSILNIFGECTSSNENCARYYATPLRSIFVLFGLVVFLIVAVNVIFGPFGVFQMTYLYLGCFFFFKILNSLKEFILISYSMTYSNKIATEKISVKIELLQAIEFFDSLFLSTIPNSIFVVLWAIGCTVIGLILRPSYWNFVLFGVHSLHQVDKSNIIVFKITKLLHPILKKLNLTSDNSPETINSDDEHDDSPLINDVSTNTQRNNDRSLISDEIVKDASALDLLS